MRPFTEVVFSCPTTPEDRALKILYEILYNDNVVAVVRAVRSHVSSYKNSHGRVTCVVRQDRVKIAIIRTTGGTAIVQRSRGCAREKSLQLDHNNVKQQQQQKKKKKKKEYPHEFETTYDFSGLRR